MDTIIKLGDFVFTDLEVPESINFGGAQQLVQHDLIGGTRVIDSLGKNDIDITWSGLMTGQTALNRAETLNQMRISGKELTLKWFNLNYKVVIQNFIANTERFYQVSYTITLRVIDDNTNPAIPTNLIGFDEAIRSDMAIVNQLTQQVNQTTVTDANNTLSDAVINTESFTQATQDQLSSITKLINDSISAVQATITQFRNYLFGA